MLSPFYCCCYVNSRCGFNPKVGPWWGRTMNYYSINALRVAYRPCYHQVYLFRRGSPT